MQLWVTCPQVSYALPLLLLRDLCVPCLMQGVHPMCEAHLMPSCLFKVIIPSALLSTGSNPNANILWFFFFPTLKHFNYKALQQLFHVWWYFYENSFYYKLYQDGDLWYQVFCCNFPVFRKSCLPGSAGKYLLNRYSVLISPSVLLDSILI